MTMSICQGRGGFSRTNQQKKLPKRLQFGNSCIRRRLLVENDLGFFT
jgi:hypothetical protein